MRHRQLILLAALSVAPLASPAAEPAPRVVTFNASVRVDVDATGKPVKVEAPQDLPDAIRAYIEQRVATWQYGSATQDNVAVPATTFVRVGACAIPTPAGDGYNLGVDFKGNGPRIISANDALPPPRYPFEALRQSVGGRYLVSYSIQPDGSTRLGEIAIIEGGNKGSGNRFVKVFRAALAQWAGSLRYEPELVNGHAVVTRMSVPVGFSIDQTSQPGTPQHFRDRQEAEQQARALTTSECRLAGAAVAPGLNPVAVDSPVKVTPKPAG